MTQETQFEFDICRNRHGGNEQSDEAFLKIRCDMPERRGVCLVLIFHAGSKGLTVHELSEELGTTPNAISGRLTELKQMGQITKIGTRLSPSGCSSAVYICTDPPPEQCS